MALFAMLRTPHALILVVCVLQVTTLQQEGDRCSVSTGSEGVCKTAANCSWAQTEIREKRRPTMCGFSGKTPIVCCPSQAAARNDSTTKKPPPVPPVAIVGVRHDRAPGVVARNKCKEYSEFVFTDVRSVLLGPVETERVDQCGTSTSGALIVGGEEAKPSEFPHMVLVGFGVKPSDWFCGGSLISTDFVLTAGHCLALESNYFENLLDVEIMRLYRHVKYICESTLPVYHCEINRPARWVLLGELDISTDQEESETQTIAVSQRIKHPAYHPPAAYNDIGLLRLQKRAQMSAYVRPACLHTERILSRRRYSDEPPIATGWGHTEFQGEGSDTLMKVALRVVEHASCVKPYAGASDVKLPKGLEEETMLCAGGGNADTCQGDSGGPLQFQPSNATTTSTEPYCMTTIVGVTSFGLPCGHYAPGIYTRVAHYVPWIEKTVWPKI